MSNKNPSVIYSKMVQTSGLTVHQGSNFSGFFHTKRDDGTFWDLAGWTGRGYIRSSFKSGILFNFGALTPILQSGLSVTIPATGTAALPATMLRYDLEIYSGASDVYRVFEGRVTVTPEVTY